MQQATPIPRPALLLVLVLAAATAGGHFLSRSLTVGGATIPSPPTPGGSFAAPLAGPVSLSARLDRTSVLEGSDGLVRMELRLAAAEEPRSSRHARPTDLMVVLDRSGSMSGEKMHHARTAVLEIIDTLRPEDRFALLTYASDARLAIAPSAATPAAKVGWRSLVAAVAPHGGTNMSAGLDLGLAELVPGLGVGLGAELARGGRGRAGSVVRMLLVSDGLANEGDSSAEGLTARGREAARREVVLSSIGVGEDFDEFTLSSIADAGSGNFYYVQHVEQLHAVLAQELTAGRDTVASSVAVAFRPPPGVRVVDAAGYPLDQQGDRVVIYPGSLFAGQERRIWVSFAVPSEADGRYALGGVDLAFTAEGENYSTTLSGLPMIACVADRERFLASVERPVWERSVVEEDYGRLRQRVARLVKAGERQQALDEIEAYHDEKLELNRTLESDAVRRNLVELEEVASEVEAAFEGADQEHKQKMLSKSQLAAGWEARRAGGKPVGDSR